MMRIKIIIKPVPSVFFQENFAEISGVILPAHNKLYRSEEGKSICNCRLDIECTGSLAYSVSYCLSRPLP